MLPRVEDAVKQGCAKVSIPTVGTDVVVFGVAATKRLNTD